jgi:hypothetical protein
MYSTYKHIRFRRLTPEVQATLPEAKTSYFCVSPYLELHCIHLSSPKFVSLPGIFSLISLSMEAAHSPAGYGRYKPRLPRNSKPTCAIDQVFLESTVLDVSYRESLGNIVFIREILESFGLEVFPYLCVGLTLPEFDCDSVYDILVLPGCRVGQVL